MFCFFFLFHASEWGLGKCPLTLLTLYNLLSCSQCLSLFPHISLSYSSSYIRGGEVNEMGVIHSYLRYRISLCNNTTEELAVVWLPLLMQNLFPCCHQSEAMSFLITGRLYHLLEITISFCCTSSFLGPLSFVSLVPVQ